MSEREILFRGKRVDNGEWVYGNYNNHSSEKSISFYKVFVGTPMTMYAVIPESVGQYTGLTDKSGLTKIFEGDIVRYKNTLHEVVFCRIGGCAFFGITMPDRGEIWNFDGITRADRMEVIGNIYDNPESLKGE